MKTKKQILTQSWVNKRDISTLLGMDFYTTCEVFQAAKKLENDHLDLYPKKVKMSSLLEVIGLNLELLVMQANI